MRAVMCSFLEKLSRSVFVLASSDGLVGAAGFEPATCSTQNYRATRLRHAPQIVLSLGIQPEFTHRFKAGRF